jgi:hypothetical protein
MEKSMSVAEIKTAAEAALSQPAWPFNEKAFHAKATPAAVLELIGSHEQLVAALREIADIGKPRFCMDGRAKVGSPNSSGYDTQMIARAALAAAEAK